MKTLMKSILASLILTGLMVTVQAQSPKMKMTTPIPESISTPDKVETSIGTMNYFDGVPTQATVDMSFDFLDKANAYKAFLSTLPTVSVNELRMGQKSVGAENSNQICIFDELMDSKGLFLRVILQPCMPWDFLI